MRNESNHHMKMTKNSTSRDSLLRAAVTRRVIGAVKGLSIPICCVKLVGTFGSMTEVDVFTNCHKTKRLIVFWNQYFFECQMSKEQEKRKIKVRDQQNRVCTCRGPTLSSFNNKQTS